MPFPTVSVIVSVYKDTEALDLILRSLTEQSQIPDQIIVSEDGASAEMATYMDQTGDRFPNLLHLTQPDEGWRKNRALNRAIAASTGEYLIFIDGDCVPYPQFVEEHLKLHEANHVLCGRRTEPGQYFSQLLRNKKLSIQEFTNRYVLNFFQLKRDHVRHYDDGIYLPSDSTLFHLIRGSKKKENHIVGCNFSCFKSDMIRINGFDEDFTMPTTGEDTDIERRMRLLGIHMKSCRNAANVIHLDHPKIFNPEISAKTLTLMKSKDDSPLCSNGLQKHLSF